MFCEDSNIKIKDYDGNITSEVSTGGVARAVTEEQFADIISNFCNYGMKDFRVGKDIGKILQSDHRTLQASAIRLALGIIIGLSEQEHTDARNETPVDMGKKIARMIEDGTLNMGYMI